MRRIPGDSPDDNSRSSARYEPGDLDNLHEAAPGRSPVRTVARGTRASTVPIDEIQGIVMKQHVISLPFFIRHSTGFPPISMISRGAVSQIGRIADWSSLIPNRYAPQSPNFVHDGRAGRGCGGAVVHGKRGRWRKR